MRINCSIFFLPNVLIINQCSLIKITKLYLSNKGPSKETFCNWQQIKTEKKYLKQNPVWQSGGVEFKTSKMPKDYVSIGNPNVSKSIQAFFKKKIPF